jgi:hypothetical protein
MIDDGTGNGTFKIGSITITNPGVDYTSVPTFSISGGGIGTSATITGGSIAANLSGGITKIGMGALHLAPVANNTYTGPTTVIGNGSLSESTLSLDVNNALGVSSKLVMSGGTVSTTGGTTQNSTSTQLKTTAESHILLNGDTYSFANSSTAHWTNPNLSNNAKLHIENYVQGSTKIQFPSQNSLTPNQLSQVTFSGSDFGQMQQDADLVHWDLVPSATAPTNPLIRLGDVDFGQGATFAAAVAGTRAPNAGDIGALMTALKDIPGYFNSTRGSTPNSFQTLPGWDSNSAELIAMADADYSDSVNNKDLQSLITYIANGGTGLNAPGGGSLSAVPEPGTIVLLLVGSIPGIFVARSLKRKRQETNELEVEEVDIR